MSKPAAKRFTIEAYVRPGKQWDDDKSITFIQELRRVAADCFDEVPSYQALALDPRALDNKVISVAKDQNGKIVAFCSGLILQVPGVGEVFHSGLTCIALSARSAGLTHTLVHKAMLKYVMTGNPFRKLWISNVACVLSSIGSVASFMEKVYPSPYGPLEPSRKQVAIAERINSHYRDEIFIDSRAYFEPAQFVFKGSVPGTVFQKDQHDARYQHRNPLINDYYKALLNFTEGDEVCQIGYVTLWSAIKHMLRVKPKLISRTPPLPYAAETRIQDNIITMEKWSRLRAKVKVRNKAA